VRWSITVTVTPHRAKRRSNPNRNEVCWKVSAGSLETAADNFEAKIGTKVPTKLKLDAMPAPLINEEPILKQYDFVKLENELLVVDPMDSSVVAVIPRKFPKDQATQGSAPSGQTHDPASQGDEAETTKKK
jgi:hypothetical protein